MSSEKAATGGAYLPLGACLALTCMGPLSGLAQSALGPILPQISAHFADNPDAGVLVRLMVSGLSAAMILGALISGFLAERIGELRLLLISLALYGLTGAAAFMLDDLYAMVACRLLLGVVNSAAGGLAMALITTEIAPGARDRWLGFYVVSGTVGVVFLMGLVGVIAHYDWRYVFLLYLVAWPIALAAALTFPRRDKAVRAAAAAEAAAGYGIPWRLMLVAMLIGSLGTTGFMYIPYHLATIGQGRPEQLAPLLMAGSAVASTASFGYGWIRRFLATIPVFVVGLVLLSAGILMIAAASDRALIFAGFAVNGAGLGLLMPHLFSSCAAATPPIYRARMMGFVRATFYGGPLVAQLALEPVLGRFGPAAAVLGIALIGLLAVLVVLVFRHAFVPAE